MQMVTHMAQPLAVMEIQAFPEIWMDILVALLISMPAQLLQLVAMLLVLEEEEAAGEVEETVVQSTFMAVLSMHEAMDMSVLVLVVMEAIMALSPLVQEWVHMKAAHVEMTILLIVGII